jgi:hypothetical protein
MLDCLCQGQRLWDQQWRTPPFASVPRLPIGTLQDTPIALPAITEPVQLALVRALDSRPHGLLNQLFAQGASRVADDKATVAILDQAAPPLSFVRLLSCPLFFCTNDQNSSIST